MNILPSHKNSFFIILLFFIIHINNVFLNIKCIILQSTSPGHLFHRPARLLFQNSFNRDGKYSSSTVLTSLTDFLIFTFKWFLSLIINTCFWTNDKQMIQRSGNIVGSASFSFQTVTSFRISSAVYRGERCPDRRATFGLEPKIVVFLVTLSWMTTSMAESKRPPSFVAVKYIFYQDL